MVQMQPLFFKAFPPFFRRIFRSPKSPVEYNRYVSLLLVHICEIKHSPKQLSENKRIVGGKLGRNEMSQLARILHQENVQD